MSGLGYAINTLAVMLGYFVAGVWVYAWFKGDPRCIFCGKSRGQAPPR